MRKRHLLYLLCAAVMLGGCSKKSPPQTEAVTETEAPTEKKETERQTERQTETEIQTEKPVTLRDVLFALERSGVEGNAQVELMMPDGVTTKGATLRCSGTQASLIGSEIKDLFLSDTGSYYVGDDGYPVPIESTYPGIWGILSEKDTFLSGDVMVGAQECYHLVVTRDDEDAICGAYLASIGFDTVMADDYTCDLLIGKESGKLVRMSTKMEFRGLSGADQSEGTITLTVDVTNTGEGVLVQQPETEAETEPDDYEAGIIDNVKNSYKNDLFGVQILGKDLFAFDPDRTAQIEQQYRDNKSRYKQEAYAEGDGVILNITSLKSTDMTMDEAVSKYLKESGAKSVRSAGTIQAGKTSFSCQTSVINGIDTKTYGCQAGERTLLITLYYKDKDQVEKMEGQIYGADEDPFWTQQEWTMTGGVRVTTPQGYSLVSEHCADQYMSMASQSNQLSIFMTGRTADVEVTAETTSDDKTKRELVSDETTDSKSYGPVRSLVVHCTDADYDYYTYVSLVTVEGTLLKFYAVSTAQNAGYIDLFRTMADNNISIVQTQPQDGEAPAQG